MTKSDSFDSLSPLLTGFFRRHGIDPQVVEAALVTTACMEILQEIYSNRTPFWEIKGFREPELVVAVEEPILAQELRNQSTTITQQLSEKFPDIKGFRLRIVNSRNQGRI